MGTLVTNKIITRGLGAKRSVPGRAGPVTQGYGGPPPFVVETLKRKVIRGRSAEKRRLEQLDEITVWAKLIEINDRSPEDKIEGWLRIKVDKNRGYATVFAEHVSNRVKDIIDYVKIIVKRIK